MWVCGVTVDHRLLHVETLSHLRWPFLLWGRLAIKLRWGGDHFLPWHRLQNRLRVLLFLWDLTKVHRLVHVAGTFGLLNSNKGVGGRIDLFLHYILVVFVRDVILWSFANLVTWVWRLDILSLKGHLNIFIKSLEVGPCGVLTLRLGVTDHPGLSLILNLEWIWKTLSAQKATNNLEIFPWRWLILYELLPTQVREPTVDPQKHFELCWLLNGRDQGQISQVTFKNLASVLDSVRGCFVCKLVRGVWELNWWILIDQRFMQYTECFVFLVGCPRWMIEID